jgi:hypothetical protein
MRNSLCVIPLFLSLIDSAFWSQVHACRMNMVFFPSHRISLWIDKDRWLVLILAPFVLTGGLCGWREIRGPELGAGSVADGLTGATGLRGSRWPCQTGPAFFFPPWPSVRSLPSPKDAVVVARRTQPLWLDEESCMLNTNAFRDSGVLFISDTGFDKYKNLQLLFLCSTWIGTAHMHEPALVLNFSTGENIWGRLVACICSRPGSPHARTTVCLVDVSVGPGSLHARFPLQPGSKET